MTNRVRRRIARSFEVAAPSRHGPTVLSLSELKPASSAVFQCACCLFHGSAIQAKLKHEFAGARRASMAAIDGFAAVAPLAECTETDDRSGPVLDGSTELKQHNMKGAVAEAAMKANVTSARRASMAQIVDGFAGLTDESASKFKKGEWSSSSSSPCRFAPRWFHSCVGLFRRRRLVVFFFFFFFSSSPSSSSTRAAERRATPSTIALSC